MRWSTSMLVILFVPVWSMAQEIERQTFGVMGGASALEDLYIPQGIGEAAIQTLSKDELVLTQGFIQPDIQIEVIDAPSEPRPPVDISYGIYPNPTQETIFLRFEGEEAMRLQAGLHDQTGRRLPDYQAELEINGYTELIWDLTPLASGLYILRMVDEAGNLVETARVVKQ